MALVNHQFNLVSSKNTFMSYQSIDEGYPFDTMPVILHTAIMTNNHKQTEKCQSSLNVDFSHENKFDSVREGSTSRELVFADEISKIDEGGVTCDLSMHINDVKVLLQVSLCFIYNRIAWCIDVILFRTDSKNLVWQSK